MPDRRLFVDAAGFVWWDNGDGTHSMARTNPDNTPTPRPFTYYEPVTDAAESTGELREQIAEAIAGTVNGVATDLTRRMADALLSGPLAALLAKLRATEALADELDRQAGTYLNADLRRRAYADAAHLVRRALDGA